MLAPGVLLSDRYRLDARLATGGMGDVWRGTDLLLGREVAVKVLLPGLVTEPDFITRFHAEARMMAALHHPGIVQVYDCGEHPLPEGSRADYLVMEYVAGEPLSHRIEKLGRLDVPQTLSVVAQAARALHAAHSTGIVHRDVKPGNLLIQPDGTVVLVDFGVARSSEMARITSTNAVPGTALYMAPEQAAGRPVSPETDIYALGAVAYHCLAGEPPYTGRTPLDVAIKHLHDEPPAPPADLPAPVAALISRALAKAPEDRQPSAAAFAAEADAAMAATTVGGIRVSAPATGPTGAAATDPDGTEVVPGVGLAGVAAAGTDGRGLGPGTLPDLPVAPSEKSPNPPATPGRGPSHLRAFALAGGATLLAVAALVGVLGFGLGDGGRREPRPTTPVPSGAPAAGPSADTVDDDGGDGGDGAAPSQQPGASAPAAPSAPAPTGSPVRTGATAPSRTPSVAPSTAGSTPSPTSDNDETPTPPSSAGPPATPDAPEEPPTSVTSVASAAPPPSPGDA